jgi:hypothetical protein
LLTCSADLAEEPRFAVTAVLTLVLRRASATMLSKMLRDEQQSEA